MISSLTPNLAFKLPTQTSTVLQTRISGIADRLNNELPFFLEEL